VSVYYLVIEFVDDGEPASELWHRLGSPS